jgi:hypothetical protein
VHEGPPFFPWLQEEKAKLLKDRLKKYCQKVRYSYCTLQRQYQHCTACPHLPAPLPAATNRSFGGRLISLPTCDLLTCAAIVLPGCTACPVLQVYKRVLDKPVAEKRMAGICQRENSFYVDTVRAFRCGGFETG